jgi:MFS family permease
VRRWVVLALIFSGIVVSYIDRGNLSLAVVPIMREFGYSARIMGTLLSCFFWTYALCQIPSGMLIDRYGIRRAYAGTFLIWSLASAGLGLSRGLAGFLTARLVLGMAESVGPVASVSYVRRNFAPKEQGLPIAIYLAGQTVGPAVGALLGTYLMAAWGWRSLFITTGLGALVWLIPWLMLAPADPHFKNAPESGTLPPGWPRPFAQPVLWAMTAFVFLSSYYGYFVLTWVPAYLTLVQKFNTIEMGHVLSTALFAMAGAMTLFGWIADRLVRLMGKACAIRLLFMCGGMLGAGTVLLLPVLPNRGWVLPVLVMSLCSWGVGSSNYWSLAQFLSPAQVIGRSIGFLNTVAQAGGAAAPLITGWLLGPSNQFTVALVVAGSFPLIACLIMAVVGPARLEAFRLSLESSIGVPVAQAT